MSIVYKSRKIDYSNGRQYVEILDGVVRQQWLTSNGNHRYTGDGNPEIVGKPESALRGYGFRKVSRSEHDLLLETTD